MGRQDRLTHEAKLKERMRLRLEQLGWEMTRVADLTKYSYRQVLRWLVEDTRVPAEFAARFVQVVPVNPGWLMTGEGEPEPQRPGNAERAMERISWIVDAYREAGRSGEELKWARLVAGMSEQEREEAFLAELRRREATSEAEDRAWAQATMEALQLDEAARQRLEERLREEDQAAGGGRGNRG